MEDRHLVAIDIGTSKIALAVAKIEGDNIVVIYYKETPSDGIRYSRVYIPGRAAASIRRAVIQAEEALGIKITQAVVGLPKYEVKQVTATMSVERTDPQSCITPEEISNMKDMAMETYPISVETDEILFGAVPQSFSDGIDFQIVENDVIGMATKKLDSYFKVFIGQRKYVDGLRLAFKDAGGLCTCREFFTPDATAKAVLYDSETENGVALVDLGGGVTTVSIYYGRIMRHYAAIPFGGKTVDSDIRTECYISDRLAENIKLAYGACMPEKLESLSEKVLQVISDEAVPAKEIPVKYLSEIITARVKEIVEAVLYEIQKSGFADDLRNGIVITGGGANLLNIANFIRNLSGYNVRTGYPNGRLFSTAGNISGINDTGAATCVGMLLMAKSENINCLVPTGDVPATEDEPEEMPHEAPSLDENGEGDLFGLGTETPPPAPEKSKGVRRGTKKKKSNGIPVWTTLFEAMSNATKTVFDKYDDLSKEDV